jgi:hypothetical protein
VAPVSKIRSAPAPSGGLNTIDGYASMPETDAVDLINWIPDNGGLRSRRGYVDWATGLVTSGVGSVMPYFAPDDAFPGGSFLSLPTSMPGQLFAAMDDGIYDITSQGVVGAALIALSGALYAGWMSHIQMSNAAGSWLLACSETDGYYTYDGTTWLKVTLGGGANQVSGQDPASFAHVTTWKRRAWFTIRDTTKAAYLAADALYGAATVFDFGPVFKRGGHLAYIANWTIDAGEGVDDFLVAVSSNGDVAVYKGTDPAMASTFALVGTWFVGQVPVGRRAYTQFGGDLIIAGADGLYPISYVTRGGADFLVASSKEYTRKISSAIGVDLRSSFTLYGWQMMVHPTERLLIVTVPDYGSVTTRCWVMSTTTNEWTRFVGLRTFSLGMIAGYAFAGGAGGNVTLLFATDYDAMEIGSSTGDYIQGRIIPAFSWFQSPAANKILHGVRPEFVSANALGFTVESCLDYSLRVAPAVGTPASPTVGGAWNAGLWNSAVWGGAGQAFSDWVTVDATPFYAATCVIDTLTVGQATISSISYLFEPGGVWG